MKTYTLKEYGKNIGTQNPKVVYYVTVKGFCGCIRSELRIHKEGNVGINLAYKDCPKCQGKGSAPIPWNDLI